MRNPVRSSPAENVTVHRAKLVIQVILGLLKMTKASFIYRSALPLRT